ncbi:hypothetical protein E8E13_011417 [Curvularia kusanoi]|uniref:Uncharacterized protein n=1 Tax=Curvularia kusanoi TaxID=90978 RepID=A0A9P4WCP2_CURKU|nr:hypothetical protein E8E13_011417 [Curvularia kusanoi]
MADGNSTALAGLKFVEALQAIAEEAVERLRQQDEASSIAVHNFAQSSDYSAWADWLARQPRQGSGVGSRSRTPPAAESSSRGATETLLDVQPGLDFTTWDGAAALQQLSLPVTVEEGSQFGVITDVAMYDSALPLADSSEDPVFLMGLTGFDMMGFSFQN